MKQSTPRSLGYRMPAEWEPQEAIWLAWPHNEVTWPKEMLARVETSYIEIIDALHAHQKIKLLVKDADQEAKIRSLLSGAGSGLTLPIFFHIPTDDAWIRDYGPTFVVNSRSSEPAMVKWDFNAWGSKYDDVLGDAEIPYRMNERLRMRVFAPGIVLEGGSIEVNGAGTVLTTEQCLLNKNRNPALNRREIETHLKEYLNVSRVLWLNAGIVGDDTDGHIDDVARFVNKNTVVCAFEEDPADQNYEILKENYERLVRFDLNVVRIPMPGFVRDGGTRLPASYANFYIANGAVVVPIFGHPNDRRALAILQKCFPDRRVVGIDCTAMVYGLGAIHCCSQQEPKCSTK